MKFSNDQLAEKRAIRLQIGRSRRRIDRRLRSLEREGRRMVSWRIWAKHMPTQSVVAALGAGLAALARLPKRRLRALGVQLRRRVRSQTLDAVLRDLRRLWMQPTPPAKDAAAPPSNGGEHG